MSYKFVIRLLFTFHFFGDLILIYAVDKFFFAVQEYLDTGNRYTGCYLEWTYCPFGGPNRRSCRPVEQEIHPRPVRLVLFALLYHLDFQFLVLAIRTGTYLPYSRRYIRIRNGTGIYL